MHAILIIAALTIANPARLPVWQLRLAENSLPLLELIVVLATVTMILLQPRSSAPPRFFLAVERRFARLARNRNLSVAAVGVLTLCLRAALIPVLGIPKPVVQDEFSYLLAGDTFAHGRLTNPPHPMWVHFETFHVISHPTYMSMYAPAEGIVLALGQRLGHPWIGQWLVTAAMCAALCWMLQAWLPPGWALFGALLALLRLGLLSYWMNTYWSASVAALGGALVLGAWPRLQRRARVRDAVTMGFGLVVLANSRPYEGLVLALIVALAMLVWLLGPHRPRPSIALRIVLLPLALVLALGAVATAYYNYRVTGSPIEMAYQINRGEYAIASYFIWQQPHPEPAYHHAVMRTFYEREFRFYQAGRTFWGFLRNVRFKLRLAWTVFLGPVLSIPLLALPRILRDSRMRFPLLALGAFVFGLAVEIWTFPHYLAPATGLLFLVLVQGIRHVRFWRWREKPVGISLVRALPVLGCAFIVLRVGALMAHSQIEQPWPRGDLERARIADELEHSPGQHLVLVRYAAMHNPDREWVYNSADIDGSKIVWARDMDARNNLELLQYFGNRHVWLIEPDVRPPRLFPFSASLSQGSAPTPVNFGGATRAPK